MKPRADQKLKRGWIDLQLLSIKTKSQSKFELPLVNQTTWDVEQEIVNNPEDTEQEAVNNPACSPCPIIILTNVLMLEPSYSRQKSSNYLYLTSE